MSLKLVVDNKPTSIHIGSGDHMILRTPSLSFDDDGKVRGYDANGKQWLEADANMLANMCHNCAAQGWAKRNPPKKLTPEQEARHKRQMEVFEKGYIGLFFEWLGGLFK